MVEEIIFWVGVKDSFTRKKMMILFLKRIKDFEPKMLKREILNGGRKRKEFIYFFFKS